MLAAVNVSGNNERGVGNIGTLEAYYTHLYEVQQIIVYHVIVLHIAWHSKGNLAFKHQHCYQLWYTYYTPYTLVYTQAIRLTCSMVHATLSAMCDLGMTKSRLWGMSHACWHKNWLAVTF